MQTPKPPILLLKFYMKHLGNLQNTTDKILDPQTLKNIYFFILVSIIKNVKRASIYLN